MIVTGTSGFSFPDWRGTFYPEQVKPREMLSFYAGRFSAVEINTTYYGIPEPGVFERMAASVSPGFEFVVKANKATTHDLADRDVSGAFLESVRPLRERESLSGVLAQFPWEFRNTEKNRRYLAGLAETYRDIPLFVEFRHDCWNRDEVYRFLGERGLLFVSVDEPQIGNMMPPVARATGDGAYIRFHGRNADSWWGNSAERYNYRYTEDELRVWAENVLALEKTVSKVYAFFNNCTAGNAARNADEFRGLVEKQESR